MGYLKPSAVTASVGLLGLYLLTQRERVRDLGFSPSLLKHAANILPGWYIHRIRLPGPEGECCEYVVLDSAGLNDCNEDFNNSSNNRIHEVVVMLHGFPDNALYYYKVGKILADKGYRVILPSLPGYDSTSVSATTMDKSIPNLASTLLKVLQSIHVSRFHLVGHDWGSSIASEIAIRNQDSVQSLTLSAVPYNTALGFARFPQQYRYSWYFTLFQLPFIPELWLSRFDGLKWLWTSWSPNLNSKPEFFKNDPFWKSVLDTFKQPGVVADALNYYRMNLGQGSYLVRALFPFVFWLAYLLGLLKKRRIQTSPIEESEVKRFLQRPALKMPVLALIGENDGCFFPALFRYVHSRNGGSANSFLNTSITKTIQGAGHFSFIEQPEVVSQHLIDLFQLPSCRTSSL